MLTQRTHFGPLADLRQRTIAETVRTHDLLTTGARLNLRDILRRRHHIAIRPPQPKPAPVERNFPEDFVALGSGYDLFGHYAYSGSVKAPIFDWRRGQVVAHGSHELPALVTCTPQNTMYYHQYEGETALELQRNMSSSVKISGSYGSLFSGSVSAGISQSELSKSRRSYTIVQLICAYTRYAFDPNTPAARALLSDQFRHALERRPS